MRDNARLMAITCGTFVLLVGILAVLVVLGRDIGSITSLIVTALVPTVTSLIALERSERAREEISEISEVDPSATREGRYKDDETEGDAPTTPL